MESLALSPAFGNGLAVSATRGLDVLNTTTKTSRNYEADEQRWAEAMVSAQAGDRQAYQRLLEELSRMISRYLVSRFGFQDFVEDCVQEILLAIHHARHTYEADRPFRPWLFAIVRNKAIDMLRKRRSYQNMLTSQMEVTLLEEDSATGAGLEMAIIQGELINALAPPLKQAVVLTKLIGFSNAEAAEQLNISETAVKIRVHRGIARLKSLLEGDDHE